MDFCGVNARRIEYINYDDGVAWIFCIRLVLPIWHPMAKLETFWNLRIQ